ncbi:MAG: hypothetical protein FWC93_08105 [Defluviitaleaceae bacterium]|nr:hypothetical protein [Defluviitaleaceae bacterium]
MQTAHELRADLRAGGTMPFESGHLQNEATYVCGARLGQGVAAVVSDTVYARRKFFHPEFDFDRRVNRAAGGRWFDAYTVGAKQGFVRDVFARRIGVK